MKIEVTQDDISNGEESDPESCPVALAMKRTLPEEKIIKVFSNSVKIGKTEYELPSQVTQFINRFDDEECGGIESECLPFSFEFPMEPVQSRLDPKWGSFFSKES